MLASLCDIGNAQKSPPIVTKSPRVLAEFDVSTDAGWLTLPVKIRGNEFRFVVDTGSAACIFDRRLRHLLGNELRREVANVFGRRREFPVFESPPFTAGEVAFKPRLGAACQDLDGLMPGAPDVDGFIGIDALADKTFTIDFDSGKLRFLDRANSTYGTPCPLVVFRDRRNPEMTTEMFAVSATLSVSETELFMLRNRPRDEMLIIDTGMMGLGSVALRSSLFDEMLASNDIRRFRQGDATAEGLAGRVEMKAARIPFFRLEGFAHEDLTAYQNGDDSEWGNMIGLEYLSRYVVTFDFPNRTLYLNPGKQFNRADGYPLSGIFLVRKGGATVVGKVAAHSPAAKAGIRAGDQILSVDRLDASKESLFAIGRQFTWPGKRRVKILRDGARHEVELILEHLDQEAPLPEPPDGPTPEPAKPTKRRVTDKPGRSTNRSR